jgi:hypothetical protein
MDNSITDRLTQLERDVTQLKQLANIDKQISALKSKNGITPRKSNFLRNFVIFLLLVGALILLAMPYLSSVITGKFETIADKISTGQ